MSCFTKLLAAGAIAAGATAAMLAPAVASGPPARTAGVRGVVLKDISFMPATLRISRGTTVRWTWMDGDTPHNVTFAARHSATKKTGTYRVRFTRRGTFRYHCTIHPGMDGRIVVR
ncbi:amidase [Baekduia soli]|uniref:Amidase n=1 Tax=Baekduia soli TaxID=496014 RepID=A0A5B8U5M6_9ACTN|nr:plastocyanin/azurin family copper-binding protein [Baekduia soli]QEC48394.1 amidase [Baekduia soli]